LLIANDIIVFDGSQNPDLIECVLYLFFGKVS